MLYLRHVNRFAHNRFVCSIGPEGGSPGPSGGGSSGSSAPGGSTAPPAAATPSGSSSSSASSPSSPSHGSTPSADVGDDALDFSSIFSGGADGEVRETPAVVTPPTAAPVTPTAAAATVPPKGAEPSAQAPTQPPPSTTPTQAAPSPTDATSTARGPQLDPTDPVSIATHLMANREAAINSMAERMFALSPEDVEALETDVVGTVPKLFARAFIDTQNVMLRQMARLVPHLIQKHTAITTRSKENEDKFWSRWPDLKPDKHSQTLQSYAVVYRQMHPQATTDQMIEALGPMVMMAAGVTPSGAPRINGSHSAPIAPGTPRPPQPSPFVPAGTGPAEPLTTPEQQPWEVMFSHPDQ